MRESKITLVGAGLVGSLLSIYLARRGYEVDVYERRPDMRKETISAGRSINLAMSTRGLHALLEVGLRDKVMAQAIPMLGRMIHSPKGELTLQPYGKDDTYYINSISRGELNKLLMTEAEKTGRVRIHFNENMQTAMLDSGRMLFKNERTKNERMLTAPVVIGTDGSASALRQALVDQAGASCTSSVLDYGYKELHIPPGPSGRFQLEKQALHIWPRGNFMLIALPNFDGSFTCTLFLPFKGDEASFEALESPARVSAFFHKHFADAVPLLENLTGTFFDNPTGHMVTVKCGLWHHEGKALVLGDAAHAIVPFYGQGMNCGFEDCSELNRLLDDPQAAMRGWQGVFEALQEARRANADAIADMAVENFVEMRDKVGDPAFLLRKQVEKQLELKFPGEYVSRYTLVTFSRASYAHARRVGEINDEILGELCRDLADASTVDFAKAGRLIRTKLAPILGTIP